MFWTVMAESDFGTALRVGAFLHRAGSCQTPNSKELRTFVN